jgi:acyl-CoA synthetase (NDP forming)
MPFVRVHALSRISCRAPPCGGPPLAARDYSRAVDLYEHQGKELFRRFGIAVPDGRVATTPSEARAAAAELGGAVVVKAQVLTGGRGKAGGVQVAADQTEAEGK